MYWNPTNSAVLNHFIYLGSLVFDDWVYFKQVFLNTMCQNWSYVVHIRVFVHKEARIGLVWLVTFKKCEFDAPFDDVLTLNPWPRFECFVTTLVIKNIGTPTKHCYDEIGLCAHNINTNFIHFKFHNIDMPNWWLILTNHLYLIDTLLGPIPRTYTKIAC